MIPLTDQAVRYLISQLTPGAWRKGTGWVAYEVVSDAIHAGLVEPRDEGNDRTVRLTEHGIAERAMMGPDGTLGRSERAT